MSVVVRGSTVYDAPTLFAIYREQLGKPVTNAGARAIAAALLAKYESDGYSRPQIKVDDSLLEVGVLRFDLLEPRIAEVRVNGDPGPHLERLESLGSRLRDETPDHAGRDGYGVAADARTARVVAASDAPRATRRALIFIGSTSTRSSTARRAPCA